MRTMSRSVSLALLLGCVFVPPLFGQQKLAQAGMKFLSVGADARAVAMGDAYTGVEGNASMLFYNPAGVARLSGLASVMIGQVQWIADISHSFAGVAFSPFDGNYGVIGVFAQTVDYGTLQGTVRADNAKGYIDVGDFNPHGTSIGLAYARALSEKFSVGGDVKYVRQNLGPAATAIGSDGSLVMDENVTDLYAFDFGLTYRTGFKSLTLGMVVRNFSKEAQFKSEGFQLPLTFRIGLAMNVVDILPLDPEVHGLRVSLDAEHPRDYPEQVKIGLEYSFVNILSLRVGYVGPADERSMSYGIGLQKGFGTTGVGVDYAYTPFGIIGNVHRFSFQFWL
jgi:hypothetical protein